MDNELIKKRLGRLRRLLAEKKLDAMLVVSVENVRYLTGFTGHDSWAIVLPRQAVLLTDSRYTEQALGECLGCRIVQRRKPMIKALAQLIGRYSAVKIIGIEDACRVAVLKAVRKELPVKVLPIGGIVEGLRVIKDKNEIASIKAAAALAWRALRKTLRSVRAGLTEMELAAKLDYHIRCLGAAVGFDTIIAFGPNCSRNHHQPGTRKLKKNDTILIDFGARVNGYTCDITRCFVLGKASAQYRKTYQAVAEAQKAAISTIRSGSLMARTDSAARRVLSDKGLPVYGHGTGHGLGLLVHESPSVSQTNKKGRFAAGQVVTVEPGVYVPGRLGIRLEDDVLVTETGCRVLTRHKLWFDPEKLPLLPSR